jgi:acyl-ACP thioesterase
METTQDLALFRYPFQVKVHEVDVNDTISPYYFLAQIQEAAIQHAAMLGLDAKKLRDSLLLWVLTRLRVTIFRYPKALEKGRVVTWVSRTGSIQAIREFTVENTLGQELAKAVSSWMVLDWETRRPKGLKWLPGPLPTVLKNSLPYPRMPIPLPKKPTKEAHHRVIYSDLDVNDHVNNLKYLAWIFDLFPVDCYKKGAINQIDVQFLKEARFDQELTISLEEDPIEGHTVTIVPYQAKAKETFLKAWLKFRPRI